MLGTAFVSIVDDSASRRARRFCVYAVAPMNEATVINEAAIAFESHVGQVPVREVGMIIHLRRLADAGGAELGSTVISVATIICDSAHRLFAVAQRPGRPIRTTMLRWNPRRWSRPARGKPAEPSTEVTDIELDDQIDEASVESFPASDPPNYTVGNPNRSTSSRAPTAGNPIEIVNSYSAALIRSSTARRIKTWVQIVSRSATDGKRFVSSDLENGICGGAQPTVFGVLLGCSVRIHAARFEACSLKRVVGDAVGENLTAAVNKAPLPPASISSLGRHAVASSLHCRGTASGRWAALEAQMRGQRAITAGVHLRSLSRGRYSRRGRRWHAVTASRSPAVRFAEAERIAVGIVGR